MHSLVRSRRRDDLPDGAAAAAAAPPDMSDLESNIVPTVFRWEHGGNHVFITGGT